MTGDSFSQSVQDLVSGSSYLKVGLSASAVDEQHA